MRSSAQLSHERMGIAECHLRAGSAADMRKHQRAAQRKPLSEADPRAGESRSGILDQAHIAALVICDAPAILVGAVATAVARQYAERQIDCRWYPARHCEKLAHSSSPLDRVLSRPLVAFSAFPMSIDSHSLRADVMR